MIKAIYSVLVVEKLRHNVKRMKNQTKTGSEIVTGILRKTDPTKGPLIINLLPNMARSLNDTMRTALAGVLLFIRVFYLASSLSPVTGDPVSSIQSTRSLTLYSSMSAVVSLPIHISASEMCPTDMILNNTTGSFYSPRYPKSYPANQTCSWKIIGKQGYRVELTIREYNLHNCDGACSCDYLEVQNSFSNDSAAGKLCGASRNENLAFYSLHESLRVVFVSDNDDTGHDGFEATYKLLNYSPPICPKEAILLSGSGKISSTNYPKSNYTASRNCTWNITVPVGKIVKFVFTDFVLSACSTKPCSNSCSYVELYDGGSTSSPLLGRYCQGSPLNESRFSTGNQMFVSFHPGQIVDRGFEAEYEADTTISVSDIQPTSSSVLNAPTSAVVSSSINDFATEVPGRSQSLSTTPNVTPSTTKGLSNSSIEHVSASPSFSSHEPMRTSSSLPHERSSSSIETSRIATSSLSPVTGDPVSSIQSTPSLTVYGSLSSVVSSPIHISASESPSQSHSTTPNATPSTTESLSNSSITYELASPSSSSHETMRTSSSLLHKRSSSSIETSRIATPSSVVDHISLCECPCGISSTFLAETSSSVSDSGSLSSFTSSTFKQSSLVLAENSRSVNDSDGLSSFASSVFGQSSSAFAENSAKRSVYESEGLSSFTSSVFGQISSALAENSKKSLYDSEGLLSFTPSAFGQSSLVLAENSWSVYDSGSHSSIVFGQISSALAEKSRSVYDSEGLYSSASSAFAENHSVSAENSWSVNGSESTSSSASTGLMEDIPSVSGIRPSSSSSVGRKIVSSTIMYRMSSPPASSVCYCPCSTSTTAPSPSSAVVSPTPTPSVASNMYPYGSQQNDSEFGLDDFPYYYSDRGVKIKTDWIGIPFFSQRHYKLYICRNGIIQLNYEWSWWWPRKFGIYWWFDNMGIIAPFWATIDSYFAFKYGHSKVYYQVYSQTKETSNEILDMASKHVQNYTEGFGDFEATWVLVVTWEKLCPYVYYPYRYYYQNINEKNFTLNCRRSNTFQAVLITNGFNAFLMYNYPSKGIQWLVDTEPEYYRYWTNFYGLPVAGWNAGDNGKNFKNLNGSGTFGMSTLDKKEGNTGVVGRHFWRIENSDGKGAVEKCFSWARMNIDWDLLTWYNQLIKSDREMACPCTGWQARFDWGRFRWSWWNSWPDWCFESRRSRFLFFYKNNIGPVGLWMRQQCCYSTEWEDWAALRQGPPDGGRVKVSFFYYWYNREETFYTDEEAFKSCCVDIPLCDLFYNYRPSHDCTGYRPPIRRWFWGDPHIKTLDGGNYTFNGIGEYTMVDARNGTFQLQARTKLAQGNSTTATIFSAGAAKEENTSTIEVKVKDGGGFHILIDRESYYGFNNLTNKTEEVGRNLSVSKTDKDCLQVSFPSTSSVQFCETKEMMSFVVTLGDNFKNATKGLLGTWNDDTEDDFTLPDGTVLPSSSSLRKIHFGFGVKWQINQSQSLFTYADNESVASFSDLDFEPMFADNITWRNDSIEQEAKAQCGDDHECLFDVASTNDLSVGLATKDISVQLVNESKQLNNFPPKIVNTSDEINATLHKVIELNITAEDDSAITFRVINKPVGATWNQTGNVLLFHWKVTSSQKINLTFVASDDQGASAIWSPTIRMCACQHDGQCVEPEEGDAENTDNKFVYLGCVCQGGYTGRFCDSDIDACKLNGEPCYAGVECTDLPPPANSSGYECGPCPSGYTGDGAQCVDIDECKSDSPKQCEHKCINTPASFFCDCNDGFKLKDDRRNCEDINECLPTNDCMQKCENSVGSYNCSCNEYFKNDPTDWRKCVAITQCSSDHGCSDVCYVGGDRKEICTCYANFELESDGKTCKDINECDPAKELHRCSHICKNTGGSYSCSCEKGFQLKKDGYECEDINECVDEDLYNCTDKYHKCVNTRGSYKCECERDTYFIDGKCRGLGENETAPTPPLSKPRNASEYEKQQAVQFSIQSGIEWDFERDKEFKKIMATVVSGFCEKNRTMCSLKDQRRKRRSLFDDLYTADEVNLLPGYPKNSSNSLQVAFYVQQPVGLYIGNISVLPRDTLVAIMIANKSDIEKAIEANISGIEALFKPTTTTESPTAGPAKSADDNWKWIVIGVVIGVVVILLIGLLIFCLRKRKRDVKPITDPSQEDFAEQGGAEKEKSFGSGSQSA